MSGRPAPLDEAAAQALLARQKVFVQSGLRGSVQRLRRLQGTGALWEGALGNASPVGILVKEADLARSASALTTAQDFIEAPLTPYGPDPRRLRVRDYLYHEFAWDAVCGSCCLIDPRRVLTAHHVVSRASDGAPRFDGLCVVFDFETALDGYPGRVFHRASSVFRVIAEGAKGAGNSRFEDWTTLILEAPADGMSRAPPRISPAAGTMSDGVYTLGHPNGLCKRFNFSPSTAAVADQPGCHYAFVDGFNGASGSPVFDAVTHELVGMLVAKNGDAGGVVYTAAGDYLSEITGPGDLESATIFTDSRAFAGRL